MQRLRDCEDDCLPRVVYVSPRCKKPPIIAAWLIGLAIAPPHRGENADYMTTTRAAIYARVSTNDQTCENQLLELRRYCEARGWQTAEYVDNGISGAKDRRPALDRLIADAKRRKLDVVACWKLDRFGRSLAHLITAIQTLTDAGVGFTSLGEGIDTRSATGRLMLGILGSSRSSSASAFGNESTLASPGRCVKASGSGDDHTE